MWDQKGTMSYSSDLPAPEIEPITKLGAASLANFKNRAAAFCDWLESALILYRGTV